MTMKFNCTNCAVRNECNNFFPTGNFSCGHHKKENKMKCSICGKEVSYEEAAYHVGYKHYHTACIEPLLKEAEEKRIKEEKEKEPKFIPGPYYIQNFGCSAHIIAKNSMTTIAEVGDTSTCRALAHFPELYKYAKEVSDFLKEADIEPASPIHPEYNSFIKSWSCLKEELEKIRKGE